MVDRGEMSRPHPKVSLKQEHKRDPENKAEKGDPI